MDYFDIPALNSSKLKDLKVSPKHFWAKHVNPKRIIEEPTDAMKLGTAVHMCLFEPQKFIKEYIVSQSFDRRTKVGKEGYDKFHLENIGKSIISEDEMHLVKRIKDSILNKKSSHVLLKEGLPEHILLWKDQITGQNCKAKYDWIIPPSAEFKNGAFVDLKTTVNATEAEFAKTIFKFGYYNQAAFYAWGMKEVYQTEGFPTPIYVAAEKTEPFECCFYAINESTLEIGLKENRKLIDLYDKCTNTNKYPGYEDKITMIGLPGWAINKFTLEGLI